MQSASLFVFLPHNKLSAMKKLTAFGAAALFSTALFAQKQNDGAVIAELNFTPASDVPLSVNGIKMRFFTEDNFCFRGQFNIASSNTETVLFQAGEQVNGEASNSDPVLQVDKSFDFSLAPGVELHFDGADRLSPYIGAFLLWCSGNSSTSVETWGPVDEANVANPANWSNWSTIETTPYSRFGLGAVTGADFYFADYIYLGVEFGLVFDRTNYKDTETTFSNARGYQLSENPQDPNSVDSPEPTVNGSESSFGPSVGGSLRLGYCFGR